jgi:hypothetical protein
MWQQLKASLEAAARQLRYAIGKAAMLAGRVVLLAWRSVRPIIVLAINVIVALILLFEEWGWRPLSALMARLARFRLWALTELWIAGLPPYGALLTLAVPSVILIPAKLLGVYLLATGHFVTAGVIIVAAKFASTALITRIFLVSKPALMQIPWFAYAYAVFVPWQEALFTRVRASWPWRYGRILKWQVKNYMRAAWLAMRPRIEAQWREVKPKLQALGQRLRAYLQDIYARVSPPRRREPRQLPPPDTHS